MRDAVVIDNQSIKRALASFNKSLKPLTHYKHQGHWPGPFSSPSESGEMTSEQRRKNLNAVLRCFPKNYADRLLYTYSVQRIVARRIFPWYKSVADDLLYFETILHLEPEEPYYRDHYVHVLEVACIAQQLLDEVKIDGKPLKRVMIESFKTLMEEPRPGIVAKYLKACGVSEEDIDEAWLDRALWIAALYHDLGYFGQKSGKLIADRTSRIYQAGVSQASEGFSRGKAEMRDELIWWQTEKWAREVPVFHSFEPGQLLNLMSKLDHPGYSASVVGWLSRQVLQYFPYEPADFCALQIAAHAILCHDHTGLARYIHELHGTALKPSDGSADIHPCLFRINYWENPLAVLLILSDHIGEFDRERLSPMVSRSGDSIQFSIQKLFKSAMVTPKKAAGRLTLEVSFQRTKTATTFDHFRKDKRWFFRCEPSSISAAHPMVDLSDAPFDVLMRLPED